MKNIVSLLLFLLVFQFSYAAAPKIHSYFLKITDEKCHHIDLGWIKGDGDYRIVTINPTSIGTKTPSDNVFYKPDSDYGKGDAIQKGQYVVYNGDGMKASITGLEQNTKYKISIFEYNVDPKQQKIEYLSTSGYGNIILTTGNIKADFSIDNSYQCLRNNKIKIQNKSSNSYGSIMSYKVDFGDGNSAYIRNPEHQYKKGGIFKVKIVASSLGCVDSTIRLDTIVVPYITEFEIDSSLLINDSVLCYQKGEIFIKNKSNRPAQPVYGSFDATYYRWYINNTLKSNSYNFTTKLEADKKMTIKLVTGRKVKKNAFACNDSIEYSYLIRPEPNRNELDLNDSLFCLGTATLTASLKTNKSINSHWVFKGDTTSSKTYTKNIRSAGNDTLKVLFEDSLGCPNEIKQNIKVINYPTFSIGKDLTINTGMVHQLKAPSGFSEYLWSDNSTEESLDFIGSKWGLGVHDVWVNVKFGNSCDYRDSIQLKVVPIGVSQIKISKDIIYPNPSIEKLNLKKPYYNFEIINIHGQSVLKDKFDPSMYSIDIKNLEKGTYYLLLNDGKYKHQFFKM